MTPAEIAELLADLSTPERERLARAICADGALAASFKDAAPHVVVVIRALMREREERCRT